MSKRLKELERENTELKKIVADQLLTIKVLEHVNAMKWRVLPCGLGKSGAQARYGARGGRGRFLLVASGLSLPWATDIVAALDKAIADRGAPANIRSDNGPESKRSADELRAIASKPEGRDAFA